MIAEKEFYYDICMIEFTFLLSYYDDLQCIHLEEVDGYINEKVLDS